MAENGKLMRAVATPGVCGVTVGSDKATSRVARFQRRARG